MMKTQFLLTFEEGLPRGTAQQKRYDSRRHLYFKDKKLLSLERTFKTALLPYRPKKPSEEPIRLDIWLTFSIKAPKRLWGTWKATKPDADNYVKELKDAMTAVGFWHDDAQVVDLRVVKTYAEKGSITVQLETLGNISKLREARND